jgi:anaerobic selenocysteine-containing dehydrogenase
VRIHPDQASKLGLEAGDLVELLGNHPAPLRAWAQIAGNVSVGSVPLDAFGRRALGVETGDKIGLRKLATILRPGQRAAS